MSKAHSASEAAATLTAPPTVKPQPKTFNHAIARAALASSQLLQQSSPPGNSPEDPLASALEKYALAEEKVGEARLAQDAQIQSRFLAGWTTTLNTNIQFATKARRAVETSRLSLDATKAAKRSQAQTRGFNPDDETNLSEEARAEILEKEDEFVSQVEEAQGVMKNVCHSCSRDRTLALTTLDRFSTLPSHYATWLISSLLSLSTTRRLTRSCQTSHRTLTNYRLTRRVTIGRAGKLRKRIRISLENRNSHSDQRVMKHGGIGIVELLEHLRMINSYPLPWSDRTSVVRVTRKAQPRD